MRLLFAKKDKTTDAPFLISSHQAEHYNNLEHGIFITVNEFNSEIRRKTNVKKILSWYFEIDSNEPTLDDLINKSIIPSRVIKTKNGYHVYYDAANATEDNYSKIQLRLNEVFGADENAKDITRILRMPGYYHHKEAPFLVSTIFESTANYREEAILLALPKSSEEEKQDVVIKKELFELKQFDQNDFGVWITSQNQMNLLIQLSGTSLVCFDTFEFYPTSRGYNTLTNGKPSAWFIDQLGRIGSNCGGGPTVIQFVSWYFIQKGTSSYDAKVKAFVELKQFFRGA